MKKQPSILIIGTGPHAKVIIDLFRAENRFRIAGLVGADTMASPVLDVPVIGLDADLARLRDSGITKSFVAIGDNSTRLRLGNHLQQIGFEVVNVISPSAVVAPSTRLGIGIAIMAGVVINADTDLANFTIVNTRASVDHDGRIGEGAHIGPGATLAGNVTVGRLAFLGVGTNVIPGRSIGEGAILGAGSCVVRDIPRHSVARGVPAKVVRSQ